MSGTVFTYLWCIVINKERKVLIRPFQLLAPLNSDCDLLFLHLRIAAPSLRSQDLTTFSLHKPCSDIPSDSGQLEELLTTAVDLSARVDPTSSVQMHFPVVRANAIGNVNAVICLNTQGTFQFYQS